MDKFKARFLEFDKNGDHRGNLVVVEGLKDIPFEIKRIFYIYGSNKNAIRGCHANKKSEFVLINVSGTSKVKVDNGSQIEIFELNKPNKGIYIPRMVWKDMYDFSEDSILLVICSEVYDSNEYIRDKEEYYEIIKYIRKNNK